MTAEESIKQQDLLHFSKIKTTENLRAVLEAKRNYLVTEINRLSFSTSPENDKARTAMVAQFEVINELICRI